MVAVYVSLLLGVLLSGVTPWALLGVLTAWLTYKAVQVALVHYDDSQQLVPANAGTIQIHMLTGLLMILGYMIEGLL